MHENGEYQLTFSNVISDVNFVNINDMLTNFSLILIIHVKTHLRMGQYGYWAVSLTGKLRIQTLHEQGYGGKALVDAYPLHNW